MSPILELNLPAKKKNQAHHPHKVKLEVGKRYITRLREIVGPLEFNENQTTSDIFDDVALFKYEGCLWNADGTFSYRNIDHPNSIAHEWFPSWAIYYAWLDGKQIEVLSPITNKWVPVYQTPKMFEDLKHIKQTPLSWWRNRVDGCIPVRVKV